MHGGRKEQRSRPKCDGHFARPPTPGRFLAPGFGLLCGRTGVFVQKDERLAARDDSSQRLVNFRIEHSARQVGHSFDGLLGRHFFLVGTRCRQRIVDFRRRNDTAAERHFFPAQTIRVAGPVESLMMTLHHRHDSAEMDQRREYLGPDDDVLLDVLELVGRERPFLINHRVPCADLAEVVEPSRHANAVDLFLGESHLGCNVRREIGNARRMPAQVGIFRFQRVNERFERGGGDALQPMPFRTRMGGSRRGLR